MTENQIAKVIVDVAFKIHTSLGPGLLESVYQTVLAYEIEKRGLKVCRQLPIPIKYDNVHFEEGFRADLIVEEKVIVELKSKQDMNASDRKQIQTHLRLTKLKLGYLLNFGAPLMKNGIVRAVNGLEPEFDRLKVQPAPSI